MPPIDDSSAPRRGRLSAFQLLKAWLFDRTGGRRTPVETEFLNTRDGHELAKFAQQAFGTDAARNAQRAAVQAEQGRIDALIAGNPRQPAAGSATTSNAVPQDVMPKTPVDLAVRQLEVLRAQGLSVETLAEALIIIENREVKQRAARGA
ncbi:MAG: hypothetical protein ABS84_05380 [Rubrivivax sp. SCN 71-131]|nr:MAG: hypothetical protein ABS84_05380 [Rubrivivax sp. SCN 71-131]